MRGHRANLDLLRAIAIIMVLIHHIGQSVTGIPKVLHQVFSFGGFGVDLFFILSGWLIGGIFFREYAMKGQVNVGSFWARRWLRTMPPYYAALLLSWGAVYVARHEPFDIRYLFFLQNYSDSVPFFKISWSLCIEEHFYLFLPLFLFIFLRVRAVPAACMALIAGSFLLRLRYNGTEYPDYGFLLTATHFRLDGLAMGVLCAYYYNIEPTKWKQFTKVLTVVGMIGGAVALGMYAVDNYLLYSIGIFCLSVFFASLLVIAVNKQDWAFAKTKAVLMIAVSSYSMYLMHALAINVALQYIPGTGLMFVLGSLALTAVSTFFFHRFVEDLSKRMRDKWFPSQTNTRTQSPLGEGALAAATRPMGAPSEIPAELVPATAIKKSEEEIAPTAP